MDCRVFGKSVSNSIATWVPGATRRPAIGGTTLDIYVCTRLAKPTTHAGSCPAAAHGLSRLAAALGLGSKVQALSGQRHHV